MAHLQFRRNQIKNGSLKKQSRKSENLLISVQTKVHNYFNLLNGNKENMDNQSFDKKDQENNQPKKSFSRQIGQRKGYENNSVKRVDRIANKFTELDVKYKLMEKPSLGSRIFQKRNTSIKRFQKIEDDFPIEENTKQVPYFVECLRGNNKISKEAMMHIHLSLMTFKSLRRACFYAKNKGIDPKIPPPSGKKTIIFDMDETLIHTNEALTAGYQIKVPFRCINGRVLYGYVCVRPYAKEILKRLSEHFDIFIFTAGSQPYADPILDHIDPDRVIQHRLYRESCTLIDNQVFVKDLRIIGRKLQSLVLIDNAPHTYMLQMNNGIPILPYYKGSEDTQLYSLQKYLMSLKDVEDVRKVNSETFQFEDFIKYDSKEKLVCSLYNKFL